MISIANREIRRSGATLVEVLVAIFLMGIGMLALLTLFPIGVLRMQQAILDDRTAQASINASAIATAKRVRFDGELLMPDVFENPDRYQSVTTPVLRDAEPDGPSYPVLVDPTGWLNAVAGNNNQRYVAGVSSFSRVRPSFAASAADTLRWFAINDEIPFDPDTAAPATNPFDRNTTITWAYLVQRPRTSDPSLVNLSVVVFNRRPVTLRGDLTPAENRYAADFDLTRNTITLDATSGVVPSLGPGDWILDATVRTPVVVAGAPVATRATPHANFYRIVSVTELAGPRFQLEVQTPIRGFRAGTTAYPNGQVIFMEGVSEVYEKGVGRLP